MPQAEALLILLLTCSASIKAGELIEGVYNESLTTPGYYLVTTIPEGATSINVTELTHSKNFLAIRLQNKKYLFNEDYKINWSDKYEGAGTIFIYIRRSRKFLETFYSPGPLNSSIDVMLGYQEKVPQVFYQYELPVDFQTTEYKTTIYPSDETVVTESGDIEVSSTTQLTSTDSDNVMLADEIVRQLPMRPKRRRVAWKLVGFTKCNKTCGGGFQMKRFICVSQRNGTQLSNEKCSRLQKPKQRTVECNSIPCMPQWQAGPWSQCSVSCGSGLRTRKLQCTQEMSNTLRIHVDVKSCPEAKPTGIWLQELCYMPDCNAYSRTRTVVERPWNKVRSFNESQVESSTRNWVNVLTETSARPNVTARPTKRRRNAPRWKAEEWSPCSAKCGPGKRTRVVTCVTHGKPCKFSKKPHTEEACNVSDCKTISDAENEIPEALEDSTWLYSEWPEKCSAECGTGVLHRRLYCENYIKNSTCNEKKIPYLNRTCFNTECAQWFAGPWSQCSSSCEVGVETRNLVCVSRFLGPLKVVDNSECNASQKPESMRVCSGPPCKSSWFMSDWSRCSQPCGGGTQVREVKCVGPDGMPINAREMECDEEKKPDSKRRCNEVSCNAENVNEKVDITKSSYRGTNDVENKCQDLSPDCRMIRQKGETWKNKCQMEVFRNNCCKACLYASYINGSG